MLLPGFRGAWLFCAFCVAGFPFNFLEGYFCKFSPVSAELIRNRLIPARTSQAGYLAGRQQQGGQRKNPKWEGEPPRGEQGAIQLVLRTYAVLQLRILHLRRGFVQMSGVLVSVVCSPVHCLSVCSTG